MRLSLDLYIKCVINPFIPLHVSIWAARGLSLFKKLCNIIWRRDVTLSLSLTVVFARHFRSSQLSLIWSPLESLNRLLDGPSLVYLQSVQVDQFCHSIWPFMTEHLPPLIPNYKRKLYQQKSNSIFDHILQLISFKLPVSKGHSDIQKQSLSLHSKGNSPLKTQAPKLELCCLAMLVQSESFVHVLSGIHINSGNPTTHFPPCINKE